MKTPARIVGACRALHAARLSDSLGGVVAARDEQGRGVWITTNALVFDEVTSESVILVASDGDVAEGSGVTNEESDLALQVMAARHDVTAVVHAHWLYATAFGATDWVLGALSHGGVISRP